jgi:hypothetical protein
MINFSKAAARELDATWLRLIDGGTGDAFLEFYPGTMPRSPDDPAPSERLLARLRLQPTSMRVDDGQAIRSGDAGGRGSSAPTVALSLISQSARRAETAS